MSEAKLQELKDGLAIMKATVARYRFCERIFAGAARELDGSVRAIENCIQAIEVDGGNASTINEVMVRMHRDGAD